MNSDDVTFLTVHFASGGHRGDCYIPIGVSGGVYDLERINKLAILPIIRFAKHNEKKRFLTSKKK